MSKKKAKARLRVLVSSGRMGDLTHTSLHFLYHVYVYAHLEDLSYI